MPIRQEPMSVTGVLWPHLSPDAAIPALIGNDAQLRQAHATRNGHIQALLDMERNNTADGAVGSAIAKLTVAWTICNPILGHWDRY
jgi:hypothetical protein